MAFSATMAALEGFRLTRRQPAAVAVWAVLMLVFNLAAIGLLIMIAGPAMTEMSQLSADQSADPERMLALMGPMAGAYGALIPLSLVFIAMVTTAVYRASSSEKGDTFGFLRLGIAEFRQVVVSLVVGLMALVALFVIVLVLGMIMGMIGVAMGGSGTGAAVAMVLIVILLYFVMLAGWLGFYVKFSFAGPMTFVEKRIRIFESWKATSGRFWPLMGCYLFAGVLGVVVALLGLVIGMAAVIGVGGDVAEVFQTDMTSMATYFTPGMLAYVVISSIFNALTYAIFLSPAMAAYLQIHGRAEDISGTFS